MHGSSIPQREAGRVSFCSAFPAALVVGQYRSIDRLMDGREERNGTEQNDALQQPHATPEAGWLVGEHINKYAN
jgi:hypothetical protein